MEGNGSEGWREMGVRGGGKQEIEEWREMGELRDEGNGRWKEIYTTFTVKTS